MAKAWRAEFEILYISSCCKCGSRGLDIKGRSISEVGGLVLVGVFGIRLKTWSSSLLRSVSFRRGFCCKKVLVCNFHRAFVFIVKV